MSGKLQRLQLKANILAVVVAFTGMALSWFVYQGMATVRHTAHQLMTAQLPAMIISNALSENLGEQERILYEYYATADAELYKQQFLPAFAKTTELLNTLATYDAAATQLAALKLETQQLAQLSNNFDVNMASGNISWDLAREHLAAISETRRIMLPQLADIVSEVSALVESGYIDTQRQLARTTNSVLAFSLALFLVFVFLAAFIHRYIRLSVNNERLALFPQRNPHPIFSIDQHGDIAHANPATSALLKRLGFDANPLLLLADDYVEQLRQARQIGNKVLKFQHQLTDGLRLSYEIHWLSDIKAFDIHLQDISAEHLAKQQLTYNAYHHDVSGLANRNALQKDLAAIQAEATVISFVLIDIRNYAPWAAKYGLSVAQDIAVAVAQAIQKKLDSKHQEHIYHLADASLVLLVRADNNSEQLNNVLLQVKAVASDKIDTAYGNVNCALAIGITEYPRCSKDTAELLLHAQIALSQIRSEQPLAINYFDHNVGSKYQRQQQLISALEQAIGDEELLLHFQPQQSINTGQLYGAEALLRWQYQGNWVSPAEFIPLAEQTGLILPLGNWILRRACQHLAQWRKNGLNHIKLAVNISARQFGQPDFVERISALLAEFKLPPAQLELELTESTVMEDNAQGIKVLSALRDVGVSLAIDDFGTGYSSLAYLRHFPVDKLKIDQSFIKNLQHEPEDQAIVLSLCQMAQNLKLTVVAEGVEQAEQLLLLRHYKCDVMQGYYYSKPLPEKDFLLFMAKRS